MGCLKVTAHALHSPITIRTSIVCSVGANNIALMVDEGYLFVSGNNSESLYLYVNKNGRLSFKKDR